MILRGSRQHSNNTSCEILIFHNRSFILTPTVLCIVVHISGSTLISMILRNTCIITYVVEFTTAQRVASQDSQIGGDGPRLRTTAENKKRENGEDFNLHPPASRTT